MIAIEDAMCGGSGSYSFLEFLKAAPSVVTAITAIVGVYVAKRGLDKWHIETIGKRKTELAEQSLVAFYEARDAIKWALSRGSFGGEGESRKALPDESSRQTEQRNVYFLPIERLNRDRELFARLRALRYPFIAYFGKDAGLPFNSIHEVHVDITTTASVLIQMTNSDGTTGTFGSGNVGAEMEQKLWAVPGKPDSIGEKVDLAIQMLESICKPVLEKVR